jgi:transposase-like protein
MLSTAPGTAIFTMQWDNVKITCGSSSRRAPGKKTPAKRTKPIIQKPRCKACLAKKTWGVIKP